MVSVSPQLVKHVFICSFFNGYSKRCEVIMYCSVHLHVPSYNHVEHFFHIFIDSYMSTLQKCLFESFTYFFSISLACWYLRVPYTLGNYPLCYILFANMFYHSVGYLFSCWRFIYFYCKARFRMSRERKREGEGERSSIYWYTLQMAAVSRAKPIRSQEPGSSASSRSSCEHRGPRT